MAVYPPVFLIFVAYKKNIYKSTKIASTKHDLLSLLSVVSRRLLHVAGFQQQGGVAHHPGIAPHQKQQVTFLVDGQMDSGANQSVQNGSTLKVQPSLQCLFSFLYRAAQGNVGGAPQREFQYRLDLRQRDRSFRI